MTVRAEAARRRRHYQVRVGAGVAAVLLVVVAGWIVVANMDDSGTPSATPTAAAPTAVKCEYLPLVDPAASPKPQLPQGIKATGLPPAQASNVGKQVLTFATNLGQIKIEMDLSKVPCTANSMAFLANQKFFNNSTCHRVVKEISALQCGDPAGSGGQEGQGGPEYRFANENLPTGRKPAYTTGDVAMANADQQDQPSQGTNGSQFFFVYGDTPLQGNYTLLGKVTEGLDIIKKVAAGGDDNAFGAEGGPGGGHPKTKLTFLTVTPNPTGATAPAAPAAPATPAVKPTPTS